MLAEIYRYAKDREAALDVEAGFATKRIRWLLVFSAEGEFIAVAPAGPDRDGKEVKRCPDIAQKTGKRPLRDFLADTADHAVLFTDSKSKSLKALVPKHKFFVDLLEKSAEVMPEFKKIAIALRDEKTLERIRFELRSSNARAQDLLTFAVSQPGDDRYIPLETDRWHDWWRATLPSFVSAAKAKRLAARTGAKVRCLLTGELVHPELTHGQVTGLPGGRSSGMSVVSYDGAPWRSFGLQQSENASIGVRCAELYVAGLQHLIDTTGQTLAGAKVVHWYAGADERPVELSPEQDPIQQVTSFEDPWGPPPAESKATPKKAKQRDANAERRAAEQEAQALAREFLRSVKSGQRADLADYRYYAITLSGSSARVMVRDFVTGRFGDLCAAVAEWFDDLDIVARDGMGLAPSPKFGAVLGAMVRELKDIPPPTAAKLWRCAIANEPIPESFAAQALHRAKLDFIQGEAPKHARMGLLRAHLYRKGDHDVKPHLNEDHPDPAYHCGRLLAVLADIQYAAMGDVGAGIIQRYYAAASATPALVLGRLIRLANTGHLPKVDYDRRQRLEQRLAGIWGRLNQDPPTTLSLTQQSLFAMGYYQQIASR